MRNETDITNKEEETKMSNELKSINQVEDCLHCHTSNCNPSDYELESIEETDFSKMFSSRTKSYKSILDYCTEVAEGLSQRQAFYVGNAADVLWKVQEWEENLPTVEIFYAVKANPDPILLQLLVKLGISFDCASKGEIRKVLEAGSPPGNIIFAHTIKPVEELEYASEKDVDLMTADNEDELLKIHRVFPNARILLRIKADIVDCILDMSDKFGCSVEEAITLLESARQLGLKVVGISFHVGSMCADPNSYVSTIRMCRRLFDKALEMGFDFTILDIGGGFPGMSGTQDLFNKMAASINAALKENFPDGKIRIIGEPGYYLVCSAFSLITTVLGRRCCDPSSEGRPRRYYYLNDGSFGSFSKVMQSILPNQPTPVLTDSEMQSRTKFDSKLYGQTCCPLDIIDRTVILPDLKVGERLLWRNRGAYCASVSSAFNGVLLPVTRYVFVQDQRLKRAWINKKKGILNFLSKHATYMARNEDDI